MQVHVCKTVCMVRILTSCGTLYTAHTGPLSSEMKQHKVFQASFMLILQLGLPEIPVDGCHVLISLCFELACVC